MKTIKTTILILPVLFAINVYALYGSSSKPTDNYKLRVNSCTIYCKLAPVTPSEADFDEPGPDLISNYDYLKPITPKEASFDDTNNNPMNISIRDLIKILGPVTPNEADFNDTIVNDGRPMLKPVTQSQADVTENEKCR